MHPSPLIASEGLHGSIIDNLDRITECLTKIKTNPAAAQIVWLAKWPSMDHRAGVSDRDGLILPVLSNAFHIANHFVWRHGRSRRNLARLLVSCGQNFDVRSSYINHQSSGLPRAGAITTFFRHDRRTRTSLRKVTC